MDERKYLWMNACMHDNAKVHRIYMVRVSSTMLESRVTTPFGKDYGFKCTCITGSTKVPKVLDHFRILSDTEKNSVQQRSRKKFKLPHLEKILGSGVSSIKERTWSSAYVPMRDQNLVVRGRNTV
ncbi:hypothetical protein MTR_0048s0020 [Medicago truncatula]|uniref:Uncharacterized protein n=1 Tax=Medicago truncatula TaxID=3880 RepID=A0A072TI11_MEDTR|nr:hypothetical protein MTR_0048s0020 [Medicago truncatula]